MRWCQHLHGQYTSSAGGITAGTYVSATTCIINRKETPPVNYDAMLLLRHPIASTRESAPGPAWAPLRRLPIVHASPARRRLFLDDPLKAEWAFTLDV
jgi:hypothetical protein